MATFDLSDPKQFQRLDWKILQNGAVSLYRDATVLEADCAWFRNHSYREHRFDETTWLKRENFFAAMDQQLALPYSSGKLDTLHDLLIDIEVPHKSGTIFVFWRFDIFARRFARDAHAVLDIMEDVSRRFLLTGQRFLVLVHSNDTTLTFDPVGARPVLLNPTEWRH